MLNSLLKDNINVEFTVSDPDTSRMIKMFLPEIEKNWG